MLKQLKNIRFFFFRWYSYNTSPLDFVFSFQLQTYVPLKRIIGQTKLQTCKQQILQCIKTAFKYDIYFYAPIIGHKMLYTSSAYNNDFDFYLAFLKRFSCHTCHFHTNNDFAIVMCNIWRENLFRKLLILVCFSFALKPLLFRK